MIQWVAADADAHKASICVLPHPYMPWLTHLYHVSFLCAVTQGVMADACSTVLVGAASPVGCCVRDTTWVYGLLHSACMSIVESWHTGMSCGTYASVTAHVNESCHTCMSHGTHAWVVAHMHKVWHIEWIVSHMNKSWQSISHGTRGWVALYMYEPWHN